MGRRCTVCAYHAREAIEAAIHGGTSLAEAAALYPPLTKSALARHMSEHVAPVRCDAVAALPEPMVTPPMVRLRERASLSIVKPGFTGAPAPAENVVAFRGAAPIPDAPDSAAREAPTPLGVAILLQNGYSLPQIAGRFSVDEATMATLLAELEDAYIRQAAGFSSAAVVGRLIFKAEYAIAELERLYQAAAQAGRNREARECRRDIAAERRELRSILRENGITRPLHPQDLFSDDKSRRDCDDIHLMVKNTLDGVFVDADPIPVQKPRLIG